MAGEATFSSNALSVAHEISQASAKVGFAGSNLVRHYGVRLQASVKAHAAGRPGPRMVTGDYNRSIALEVSGGLTPVARVGTNRPQGKRLEFGFHGTDSRGRRYNQPPYPHFGPAFNKVAPEFERAVAGLVDGLF